MEFLRDFYLNELLRRRGNGFVKVITGLRRSGKSYLLRTLFRRRLLTEGVPESAIVEMAFDERDNRKFRDPDVFYDFAKDKLKQSGTVFLLDEIQFLDDFESVLNGLLGKGRVPLHWAAIENNLDAVKLLIARGADPLQPDELGHYPSDLATSREVVEYLRSQEKIMLGIYREKK